MTDFVIAVFIALLPNGQIAFETLPVETYAECLQLTQTTAEKARAAGLLDVRTACIPSSQIGQNGL